MSEYPPGDGKNLSEFQKLVLLEQQKTAKKLDGAITYTLQKALATASDEMIKEATDLQARIAVSVASGDTAALEKAVTKTRTFFDTNFPGAEERYDQKLIADQEETERKQAEQTRGEVSLVNEEVEQPSERKTETSSEDMNVGLGKVGVFKPEIAEASSSAAPTPAPAVESKSAMKLAFEKKKPLKGKVKKVKMRPAEKLQKEQQEEAAFDAQALQAMENEGGRVPEDGPSVPAKETPNPALYSGPAENAYRELAEIVKKMGLRPEDLGTEAWKDANAALNKVEELAKLRAGEQDPKKSEKLDEHIRQQTVRLVSKKMREHIEKAAQKFVKSSEAVARESAPKPAETSPNIGQQDKLLKALLVPEGDVKSVLNARKVTLLPEERVQALALLLDPAGEEKARTIIGQMDSFSKMEQYGAQLELLKAKAKETLPPEAPAPAGIAEQKVTAEPKGQNVVPVGEVRKFDEKGAEYVDFVEVPGAAASPEEVPEPTPADAETRKDKRNVLRGLIGRLVEGTKEKIEWWKSSEEHLIRRKAELDAEAEKIGGIEGLFRSMGEKYNKLNWKTKLAVGASLGVGAALTGGTLAMTIPLLFIAAQRAAGLSTMYLKFEKDSHQEKWGKEKAFLKAGIYTVLMGVAIKEAIEYASETDLAHAAQVKVENWLGGVLGHEAPPAVAEAPQAAAPSPEVPQPAAAGASAPTPEASATYGYEYGDAAAPPEVAPVEGQTDPGYITSEAVVTPADGAEGLSIEVKATAGKGYEYMMKRVWEQLQDLKEQGLDPSQYDKGTDIRQLLDANPKDIDALVHNLASDKAHGFFNPDGTSIRIDADARMTIGSDGQLHLIDPIHGDMTRAVEGMRTTPVYPAAFTTQPTIEVPAQGLGEEARLPYPGVPIEQAPAPVEDAVRTPVTPSASETAAWQGPDGQVWRDSSGNPIRSGFSAEQMAPTPEVSAPVETAPPAAETPATSLPTEDISDREPIPTVDLTQGQQSSIPTESAAGEMGPNAFVNNYGTLVDPDVTHVYQSAKGLYMFGGGDLDTQAEEYAAKNHASVFVDKSYKNWLGWTTSRVIEYVPTEDGPPTMIIHNGPSLVPDPKEFTKRIF